MFDREGLYAVIETVVYVLVVMPLAIYAAAIVIEWIWERLKGD